MYHGMLIYQGSTEEGRKAKKLVKGCKVPHDLIDADKVLTDAEELPVLMNTDGNFPGLEAIQTYLESPAFKAHLPALP